MKKINIAAAVFTVIAAASCAMAEGGTMGNLASAGDKIASINMKENFNKAGSVLDSFYTGGKEKSGPDSSVVYAEKGSAKGTPVRTEKDICNAKPSKIGKLASKVKPLAAGTAGAALLNQNKTYSDDVHTVVDYVVENSDAISHVADEVGHAALAGAALLTLL